MGASVAAPVRKPAGNLPCRPIARDEKRRFRFKRPGILPGFGISLGFAVTYLSLIVLIPLSAIFLKTATMHWARFVETVTSPRVMASYRLTFGASFLGAAIDSVFGFIVAWVLARYSFPGKRIADALVDLPFALPTAVAGIALTSLYAPNGWLGRYLHPLGIDVAFTRLGVVVALTFIGLPFVVRSVQPVIRGSWAAMWRKPPPAWEPTRGRPFAA